MTTLARTAERGHSERRWSVSSGKRSRLHTSDSVLEVGGAFHVDFGWRLATRSSIRIRYPNYQSGRPSLFGAGGSARAERP